MTKKPFIVVGGGGHAKVVVDALTRRGCEILGVCDIDRSKEEDTVLGVRVLGDDAMLANYAPGDIVIAMGIGSSGRPAVRRSVFDRLHSAGYAFPPILDTTAFIGGDVALGDGAQVLAGAVVQPDCRIGVNVIINTRASVDHDCDIGDHSHVAPGATMCGGVRVGAGAHIGAGAVVIQGVSIGADCVVGAGAVVLADVSDGEIVVGNPAGGVG